MPDSEVTDDILLARLDEAGRTRTNAGQESTLYLIRDAAAYIRDRNATCSRLQRERDEETQALIEGANSPNGTLPAHYSDAGRRNWLIGHWKTRAENAEHRADTAAAIALEEAAKEVSKHDSSGIANCVRSLSPSLTESVKQTMEQAKLRTVLTYDDTGRLVAVTRQNAEGQIIESLWEALTLDELSERFIQWPLPDSVCADLCATDPSYPHQRYGTNLLSKAEAKEMLRHVLGDKSVAIKEGR